MDMLIDFSKLSNTQKNNDSVSSNIPIKGKKRKYGKSIKHVGDKITAKDIIHSLSLRFINHDYLINNVYLFTGWESDFVSFSDTGYLYEFEIKVAKSDYWDDFDKKEKHLLLESKDDTKKPNRFYYAVPKGLLSSFDIPAYAGLIEVDDPNKMATIIKEAPLLHKEKMLNSDMKETLLKKFYFRYKDMLIKNFDQNLVESD